MMNNWTRKNWRQANVSIYLIWTMGDPKNHRLLSLISAAERITEKLIKEQAVKHQGKYKLKEAKLHGF